MAVGMLRGASLGEEAPRLESPGEGVERWKPGHGDGR